VVTPTARRELVAWVRDAYQLPTRRACRVTGVARSSVQYRSRRPPQAPLRQRLRELATSRVSYGYRRLHVLLRREGWPVNAKRVHRLYCEEHLQLARKRPRRRKSVVARPDRVRLAAPNERWAMDFVHDVLATGEKIRVLTLIDLHTRECLALAAQRRFRGEDVGRVLSDVGRVRGVLAPVIQADQGTEFTSTALDHWAYWNHVQLAFSRPGRPGDNALCEAFNGSLRREVLSQQWFASLPEAQHILETWRQEYNNERPHKSLANQPPARWATGGHYVPSRARLRS
jgi:putative transposase